MFTKLSFSKKMAVLVALLFTISGHSAWAQSADVEETISMVVGQQRVLNLSGVTRVSVGNSSVINVKTTKNGEIIITAVSNGVTELTIWRGTKTTKYSVNVSDVDIPKLAREVSRLLGKREGINVRTSGQRIYIDGKALTLEDIERAEEVANLYSPIVRSLVKLDPSAHALIAQQINKVLSSAGVDNAKATVVGSTVFLEGSVNSEGDMKKAEILVKSISSNVQSVLRIGPSKMVQAEVEFVELALNSTSNYGFTWPQNYVGSVSVGWSATTNLVAGVGHANTAPNSLTHSGSMSDLSFGLSLAFNDGATRVLARPTLVAASGQKAEFLVGGEVPIVIKTADGVNIEFKEYGVRLNLTPYVDVNSIQADILAEVSAVDQSVSVMDVPGFSTRRVKTTVTVRDGETIVLGGLVQRKEGKDVAKLGLLGHIPILGELFKSRNFREEKTDLVIFVTPRLIDPTSDLVKKTITGITKRYQMGESEVKFSIFD